tara:strand:- start:892 stop:1413 length:522 start_codon:yes stop_codon:yes gene_type:complete
MDQVVKKKFNFNTVSAIFFIALAIILYLIIPSQIDKPLIQLSFGQFNLPPELFPQIVAGCMLVLGVWFFYKSFSLEQTNDLFGLDKEALINVTLTLIMMAIYVPLMVNLGFVVGSAILIIAMSTYFGNRNYYAAVLIGIFLPMLMFVTFRRLLLVELPPFPIDIYPLTNWSLI